VEFSTYCPNKTSAWQISWASLLAFVIVSWLKNCFLCSFQEGLLYRRCNKRTHRVMLCGFTSLSITPRLCTQPFHTFECVSVCVCVCDLCVCVCVCVWFVCRSVQYSLTNCVHYLHCTCQQKTRDPTPFSFAVVIFSLWLWQLKLCLISLECCDLVEWSDWFFCVWDFLAFFSVAITWHI
jgi:hypothetical protein